MFSAMTRAISAHKIELVVDRTFAFEGAAEAYRYFKSQSHVGKVVIDLP